MSAYDKKRFVIRGYIAGTAKVGEPAAIVDLETEDFIRTSNVVSIEIRTSDSNAGSVLKNKHLLYKTMIQLETKNSIYIVIPVQL